MSITAERLTRIIQIAILAAITYVLTLIAIPIIPFAPYLKLDISDLPILMGTVILGIGAGISITALALVLHLLTTGFALPSLLGGAVLFLSSLTVLLTVGLMIRWFRRRATWIRAIVLILLMTVNLTLVMSWTNLVTIPLYMKMIGMTIKIPVVTLIIFGIVPFNLVKGLVIGSLFVTLDRSISRSKYFDKV